MITTVTNQIDPAGQGRTNFSFQFGQSGSPIYAVPAASGNDVNHIEGATPFKFTLTSANTITVDFTGHRPLTVGEIFYGGFFTNAAIDNSTVDGANLDYTKTDVATV